MNGHTILHLYRTVLCRIVYVKLCFGAPSTLFETKRFQLRSYAWAETAEPPPLQQAFILDAGLFNRSFTLVASSHNAPSNHTPGFITQTIDTYFVLTCPS